MLANPWAMDEQKWNEWKKDNLDGMRVNGWKMEDAERVVRDMAEGLPSGNLKVEGAASPAADPEPTTRRLSAL